MSTGHVEAQGTAVLRAVITRADGRVEDLGIISTTQPKWYDVKGRLLLAAMKKVGESNDLFD